MAAAAAIAMKKKQDQNSPFGGSTENPPFGTSANASMAARHQRQNDALVKSLQRSNSKKALKEFETPEELRERSAGRIQLFARGHILFRQKLHRENLYKRLQFESELRIGGWRLFTQVMVFTFLLIAIGMSVDPSTQRGIYTNLKDSFGFDDLQGLTDRSVFVEEQMGSIATTAKDFFILSRSRYFVPESGSVELLLDMETFSSPKLLGGLQLQIQLDEFSFSGVVRLSPQFVRGYILRKRIVPAGQGSELACWGWYLHAQKGQQLHYGGHDFFATPADSRADSSVKQEAVQLSNETAFPPDEHRLLTVVVTGTTVTFYSNLENLGTAQMPRPVTDCFNNLEGMLVGDTGMTIGQLSFYPKALTRTIIEEIYIGGGTLDDLSTGTRPARLTETEMGELSRSLTSAVGVVDQSVAEQAPKAEVNLVMQAVDIEKIAGNASAATAIVAPSLPVGAIAFNHTRTVADATNPSRSYYQLLGGPWLLDDAPKANGATFDGERWWRADQFPRFTGRGVSFTAWFRNVACPEGKSCGTFMASAHESKESSARCWSAWLETDGIYWDTPGGTPTFGYPLNEHLNPSYSQKFKLTSDTWRHVTFVYNEDTDDLEYYLDGVLTYKSYWGKSVKEMDCGPVNVSIGYRWPGYTYGASVEFYDMRMYIGSPLTPTEVFNIATAPVPASPSFGRDDQARARDRCLYLTSPAMIDTPWTDTYGHGCAWYFVNRGEYPALCNYPGVADNCPIACKSKQECFNVGTYKTYFAWNSIRRIESRTANGTVCMSSGMNKTKQLELCRQNQPNLATDGKSWQWRKDLAERQPGTVRVNLTYCEELEQAVDDDCSFDEGPVKEFTAEMKANGGDFTLAFWVKPLGETSLAPDGRFLPSVSFLSTVSPPFSNIGFGPFTSGGNGEARMRSGCTGGNGPVGGQVDSEEIEMSKASTDDWTFIAISKSNALRTSGLARASVATNLGRFTEGQGSWDMCLEDPEALFNAVEVNFPMLISPVMLVPQELPFGLVQEIYYQQVGSMAIRDGPLVTNKERRATNMQIEKNDYVPKSALMATPIIFQKRVRPTATCPFEYSTDWIKDQHRKVVENQCKAPYECEDDVLQNPEATISCTGSPLDNNRSFGLDPQEFEGSGFADFLFSITDTPFVFRDGELKPTGSFVDSLTQTVKIILVFFTPQYGITTVMSVDADLSGPRSAFVGITVQHYSILEGAQLVSYVFVQCLVLIFIFSMVVDVVQHVKAMWSAYREDKILPDLVTAGLMGVDILTIVMTTAVVCLRLPSKIGSAAAVREILHNLDAIPWASSVVTVTEKKTTFFANVQDLLALIGTEEGVDAFLNVVLIVLLIRVIQCTSLHPRLALLTGTISKAMDDFWHSALLIILIMGSFAGIGTWRFGSEREEFGTFEKTMQTQFLMFLGEFLEDWATDTDLQAFIVLYLMIMFLLVLNFLLAIIVEAYMGVREVNEENEIEMEFLTDMVSIGHASVLSTSYKWPDGVLLGRMLEGQRAKFSVGFMDLSASGLFKDQKSVGSFLRYYHGFEFCTPPEIGSYGKADDGMKQVLEIERRVANLLGTKPPKLKELASQEGAKSKAKREWSGIGSGVMDMQLMGGSYINRSLPNVSGSPAASGSWSNGAPINGHGALGTRQLEPPNGVITQLPGALPGSVPEGNGESEEVVAEALIKDVEGIQGGPGGARGGATLQDHGE
uniref:Polycystin cation channel PKD1/PKD2 domain-containing protein n=1 Tax=Hemiselmis tepida TaxID=464990 RepID=A0A7S0W9M5_9CRYP|mmetsp:Transcript_33943/g.87007  ORF Transcript_33943/g.87007 Transcript_33943/m.87007 type:complete len:1698 (+) Transcript_33943:238-5331(+)|eukprot:CAMPEP_0174950196 /NCGR_PEP_ID=MMETSP1355-20121228/93435_1 /TAXON_ID=464990 /ORGANISM="Hemiselmis tepida, Strain CCMP443" /LENGTH=1697 /DNA_ID=CAMNT_0016197791 /DNA_START=131 /DNA_END=5224 /DNA_ORIENTATION=-